MAIATARRAHKPPRKLTPARIIKALRAGARLCLHHGAKISYHLEPDGTAVPVKYAQRAIQSGELAPARDGLFPSHTQSWVALNESPPETAPALGRRP